MNYKEIENEIRADMAALLLTKKPFDYEILRKVGRRMDALKTINSVNEEESYSQSSVKSGIATPADPGGI